MISCVHGFGCQCTRGMPYGSLGSTASMIADQAKKASAYRKTQQQHRKNQKTMHPVNTVTSDNKWRNGRGPGAGYVQGPKTQADRDQLTKMQTSHKKTMAEYQAYIAAGGQRPGPRTLHPQGYVQNSQGQWVDPNTQSATDTGMDTGTGTMPANVDPGADTGADTGEADTSIMGIPRAVVFGVIALLILAGGGFAIYEFSKKKASRAAVQHRLTGPVAAAGSHA